MSTWKSRQARVRTKFRVLVFLSASEQRSEGATAADIQTVLAFDKMTGPKLADEKSILVELEASGLVERQQITSHGRAKPYFITGAGLDYLDTAKVAMTTAEPLHELQSLSSQEGTCLQRAISGVIGELPEFSKSGRDRVLEVSREITLKIESIAFRH